MTKRPTIKDVARIAAVSKVTVSYVLNGKAAELRISEVTADRVRRVAQELGYVPSAIARSMVLKRTDTIALVLQHAHYFAAPSEFTKELIGGASQAAVANGFDLLLHTRINPDPRMEASALSDGKSDGILALRDMNDETLDLILRSGFPCVLLCSRSSRPDCNFVDVDNFGGGQLAAQHFLDLGHQRIGMVCGSGVSTSAVERQEGFIHGLSDRGHVIEDRYLLRIPIGFALPSIEAYLRSPDRPTAIFTVSDNSAMEVITIAKKLGIRVPEELSVIGFDSLSICDNHEPPVTSVRQPVAEMARAATEMLVKLIKKEASSQKQVIFSTTLDVRGSTAPPPPGKAS
jgi:LacI family transcriptional regulator